jgi:multidrug resistance efflux pump
MAHQATADPEPAAVAPASQDGRVRVRQPRRRHPPRPLLLGLLLALVLVAAAATWIALTQPATGPLTASGTVEFDEVTLAAESAGRISDLSAAEGSRISEGQVVGHLVDPVLAVQSRQSTSDAAQQQLTQAQLTRLDLVAPQTGVVQKQIAHRGEYVGPGAPILTVADPTNLKLTLYVIESALGRVAVGQTVSIRSDAFADRVFTGVVSRIADRAEFTPRNVQTQRDRQNLVFAVTVRLANADDALKAGLPVDATFNP